MKQNETLEGWVEAMKKVDHDHESKTQKLWEQTEGLKFIQGMKAGKSLAEVMGQFDLAKAFAQRSTEVCCSDGRICQHRLGGAGNFILASAEEQAEFVKNNKGKITQVKSHDGCGAAAIKFNQLKSAGETLPEEINSADKLGKFYSRELAEKLGADYGHTSAAEMSGPVHNERVIYLDGTGKFNPTALPELPAGFMCSGPALGLSPEYQEAELVTLAKIAIGHHGFGQRFNKENPLYIIISAKDSEQLSDMEKIARQAASQLNNRVKVDGFIAL